MSQLLEDECVEQERQCASCNNYRNILADPPVDYGFCDRHLKRKGPEEACDSWDGRSEAPTKLPRA